MSGPATTLVDVVNFNADGSCLASERWLEALGGGSGSRMCRWLGGYLVAGKPVTLGLVGGTVADLAHHNPEAIALINRHPEVFEMVLRPFSHDVALLRTAAGFRLNFERGRELIEERFGAVARWFLPPEFMLNNQQVSALAGWGVEGTFVNPDRFKPEVQRRLPTRPYLLSGVLGGRLPCVPFAGALADAYLDSLHRWSGEPWNAALERLGGGTVYGWRDGESFLLLPDGEAREARWLADEAAGVRRALLSEAVRGARFADPGELSPPGYRSYPVHSFASWFREFRMLGFLDRVQAIEQRVDELSPAEQVLFLQTVNSDILSAVEKDSPVVRLRTRPEGEPGGEEIDHTLLRSERSWEGEDFLAILGGWRSSPEVRRYVEEAPFPHLRKLRARLACCAALTPETA
jgi:hypothetical protein